MYACVMDALRTLDEGFEGPYMCHMDLSNCLCSFCLPARYNDCFRILGDFGELLSFRCLPFGWKHNPILCKTVIEHLVARAGLVGWH